MRAFRLLLCLLLIAPFSAARAQKTRKVTATYTYYAPETVSLEEAKRIALQRARIQAIADEFGTLVSQSNTTQLENRDGVSSVGMQSLGSSDVRGEWLRTEGKPEYAIDYADGMLVVRVRVSGTIREIVNAAANFRARILRNGTDDRFEGTDFREGDDLYLSFESSSDGFLTVYLVDDAGTAYCLLPYRSDPNGRVAVKANRRYLFFSAAGAGAGEREIVDEYTMTCSREVENNRIYIIFSPHPFTKAVDSGGGELRPRELPVEAFQQWLFECRRHDREMCVERRDISIEKN